MKGFTLIELIVVIAIIGVLAAILVPSMIGYVGQSKLSTANSNAKLAYTNTATYCTNCEVAGYTVTTSGGSALQVNLASGSAGQTYSKDGSHLTEALQSLMGGSPSSGIATVVISSTGVPDKTAWAKTTSDKYCGGYPVAATVEKNNTASGETWISISDASVHTNGASQAGN